MSRISRFILPIVVAIVLGPLIAALTITLVATGYGFFDEIKRSSIIDIPGAFLFFIIFSYIYGFVIAFLSGLLVSIWMLWRQPSGIVVMTAATVVTISFLGVAASGLLGPEEQTNATSNFWFLFPLALVAAAGCWFLTRRFVRDTATN